MRRTEEGPLSAPSPQFSIRIIAGCRLTGRGTRGAPSHEDRHEETDDVRADDTPRNDRDADGADPAGRGTSTDAFDTHWRVTAECQERQLLLASEPTTRLAILVRW
jgi:hypothetical protein